MRPRTCAGSFCNGFRNRSRNGTAPLLCEISVVVSVNVMAVNKLVHSLAGKLRIDELNLNECSFAAAHLDIV